MTEPRVIFDSRERRLQHRLKSTTPVKSADGAWNWEAAYVESEERHDRHYRFLFINFDKPTEGLDVDIHYIPVPIYDPDVHKISPVDNDSFRIAIYVLTAKNLKETSADAIAELFSRALRRTENLVRLEEPRTFLEDQATAYVDSPQKPIVVRALLFGAKKQGWVLDSRERSKNTLYVDPATGTEAEASDRALSDLLKETDAASDTDAVRMRFKRIAK